MAEITQCPQCQRKLNVQEAQLGQTVQCPVCGQEFTAEAVSPSRPPPPPPPLEERDPPRRYDEPPRRGRPYDDRPPPRYRDDDDYPRGRPVRRGYRDPYGGGGRPHRGGAILALGLIGMLFSGCSFFGWILGGIALSMANNDLGEMNRGVMDDSGRGMTQGGQVCGIIALVISTLIALGFCLVNFGEFR